MQEVQMPAPGAAVPFLVDSPVAPVIVGAGQNHYLRATSVFTQGLELMPGELGGAGSGSGAIEEVPGDEEEVDIFLDTQADDSLQCLSEQTAMVCRPGSEHLT
jgi:hypothetical protein